METHQPMEAEEQKARNQHSSTSNKRIKLEEDRISTLPDCLLIEILSRLPFAKYAITTGTLSKRWRYLWTSVHSLIFQKVYPMRSTDVNRNTDFFSFIDQTLTQCRQLKLKKFELGYTHEYESKFDSQVNNWIRFAVNRNVEHLNLDLVNDALGAEFVLDECFYINSCFTRLDLSGCIFIQTGVVSWTKLKFLCLSNTELDEDLIENILSGSPVLETLDIRYCCGYECLNITSKSVKNLIFCGYPVPGDGRPNVLNDIIYINAPYILSLTVLGDLLLWKLLLLNVSSLVKVKLDYTKLGHYETTRKETEQEMLRGFILKLPHVKELKIGICCFKAFFFLEATGLNFPSNLKVLDSLEIADWIDYSDSGSDSDTDSANNGYWEEMKLNEGT